MKNKFFTYIFSLISILLFIAPTLVKAVAYTEFFQAGSFKYKDATAKQIQATKADGTVVAFEYSKNAANGDAIYIFNDNDPVMPYVFSVNAKLDNMSNATINGTGSIPGDEDVDVTTISVASAPSKTPDDLRPTTPGYIYDPATGTMVAGAGTTTGGPADLNDLTRYLLKVILVIAAAMVPISLGDKLAGAISNRIGNATRGVKDTAYKTSGMGTMIEGRKKAAQKQGLLRAQTRMARGGATGAFARTGIGQRMMQSDNWVGRRMAAGEIERHGLRAEVMKGYQSAAEDMSKEKRNAYLQRYSKPGTVYALDTSDGPNKGRMVATEGRVFDRSKANAFDRDLRGQAILMAQGDAGLLNDDVSPQLQHLNELRGHMAARGDGAAIAQIKKAGGYDYLNEEHLAANANAALGQFGSAMRDAATPEKIASWGSESGNRLVEQFNRIDTRRSYNAIDATTGRPVAGGVPGVEVKQRALDSIKGQFTVGNIEKIFSSDTTGGKALKLFGGSPIVEAGTGTPGNFMGLLAQANPAAAARAQELMRIHTNEGATAQPTFQDPTRRA